MVSQLSISQIKSIIVESLDSNIRLVDLFEATTLAYILPWIEWKYLHQNQQQGSHIP